MQMQLNMQLEPETLTKQPKTDGCKGCVFRPDYTCCDKHSACAIALDNKYGICHLEGHIYIKKKEDGK